MRGVGRRSSTGLTLAGAAHHVEKAPRGESKFLAARGRAADDLAVPGAVDQKTSCTFNRRKSRPEHRARELSGAHRLNLAYTSSCVDAVRYGARDSVAIGSILNSSLDHREPHP